MRKWLLTFVIACAGSVIGVLAALWAMNGFGGLGLDLAGTVALVLGITVTVALGIALMALVFASDRSNKDTEVGRSPLDDGPP